MISNRSQPSETKVERRRTSRSSRRFVKLLFPAIFGFALVIGTVRNPDFWSTPDQRGDALSHKGKFSEAAKVYTDPLRIGIAQYRDSQFEAAAKTFARVPGRTGAYNAANSWLMHGAYEQAITNYDKALSFSPAWREAISNKELAIARRDSMKVSDEEREQESADANDPDNIVFDQKGDNKQDKAKPLAGGQPSDDAGLQATWLRRVKTTPGQFLKAKFAWQAQSGRKEKE